MKKAEKTFFVDNLAEELKSAKSVVLVNYAGLSVKNQQELKKRLKAAGAKFVVVKNTLLKRAGEIAKVDSQVLSDSVLSGQTALVVSGEDAIAPIGVMGKFAKEFDVLQFKVGVVENEYFDMAGLTKLATLPTKDVLLGQLLGVLMGPSYGLVSTLNANTQKLINILDQKSKGGD